MSPSRRQSDTSGASSGDAVNDHIGREMDAPS
jgi:hypothetical protein